MKISLLYTNKSTVKALYFAYLLCLAPNCAIAVDDAEQPVHIKSDKVNFDHNSGIALYSGNVKVNQGSRRLQSDNLTIKRDKNNKINVIIATGKPATFKSQEDPKKPVSFGKANTIKYYPQAEKVDLLDEAELTQNGDTIQGPILNYNFITGNLKTKSSKHSRATFILQPKRGS